MSTLRSFASALLSKGLISAGWYAILTGLTMLYLTWVLASVFEDDSAAPYVAVVLAVTGLWQLGRGVLSEVRRWREQRHPADAP
jgi:hypothetical protein